MLYGGMDLHKKSSEIVVKTKDGEQVKEGRVKSEKEPIEEFFEEIDEQIKLAIEASPQSQYFYDLIERLGIDVVLANPLKTRLIAEERIKTDSVDANALCDLARGNLLPTCYVPEKDIRRLRETARTRVSLGKVKGNFKNHIKGILNRKKIDYPGSELFNQKGLNWLKSLNHNMIEPWIPLLEDAMEQCDKLERKIGKMADKHEEIELIESIPGIATYSAGVIYGEIADIDRFSSEKKLYSYAGLVPSLHQSGEVEYHGNMTKQGSKYLRWVVIHAIGNHNRFCPNSNISRYYRRKKKEKPTKIARVNGARKLLQAIYWMLKNHDKFRMGG